jgi:hypothetical protein
MTFGSFRLNTLSAAMAAAIDSITATGGTISYYKTGSNGYKVHTITTTGSNSFVVSATTGTPTVDLLLVGGGGAGGGTAGLGGGGGGGGGAVVSQSAISVTAQTYTISIGGGGTGTSAADGGNGTQSTALGYTAAGGAGGTLNSAATNGGGSGANSTTSYTSTAGTYAYKGGNSVGSATAGLRAGGGGAGFAGAGVNAASNVGGAGGLPTTSTITGTTTYYAGGGGGGGSTVGQAYTAAGALSSSSTVGTGAPGGPGNNNTTGPFGSGGGGARTSGSTSYAGGTGRQGVAYIRYPATDDFVYFVASSNSGISNSTTLTVPTVEDGDIGILFSGADNTATTAPTAVTPTGWTSIVDSNQTTTAGLRIMVHYKILTAAESGTTITSMTGTAWKSSSLVVYRPSRTYTLSTASLTQQATASAPTNQTLTMTGVTGPYLAFSFSYNSGQVTTSMTSTTTSTRNLTFTNGHQVRTFESIDSSTSFATSTISATDQGQNGLASFRLVLT